MKTKLFLITLLIITFFANAQEKSNYLGPYIFDLPDVDGNINFSSEYYDGQEWFFIMSCGQSNVYFGPLTISDEGRIQKMASHKSWHTGYWFESGMNEMFLNTVVFNQKLYVFYFLPDLIHYPQGLLKYSRITKESDHHVTNAEGLNFIPNHNMAAVAVEDTLYLFFAENSTGHLKYFRGIPTENSDIIQWLSNDPISLSDAVGEPLTSVGNVAACTYFTRDNKERIMLLYPSEKFNSVANRLEFYAGIGTKFTYSHNIPSCTQIPGDNSAYYVSLAQGTVNGGWTKKYIMQFAYVTKGDDLNERNNDIRMFRNEFDLTTGTYIVWWEILPQWSQPYPMAPDFMEYYIPDTITNVIRKYLYLAYSYPGTIHYNGRAIQWESDLLKRMGSVTECSPDFLKEELWHLICVVEGPPPFPFNGWTMKDLWNENKWPPSQFTYGQTTTYTVGSNTIYKKTEEASGGFGPIKGGFKRSMQHNNHNSTTDITTLSITTKIQPPYDSTESEGFMVSFYDGPSLKRTQWKLHDYNGDTLNTDHSLFLFNFTQPQLHPELTSLEDYSNSPRFDDLYTYEGRGVEYFSGIKSKVQTEFSEYITGGVTQEGTIEFDTLYSNTTEMTKTINVGIDAKYKIFEFQAGHEIELEYTTENNTENKKGFQLEYKLPAPKNTDDSCITNFTTTAYLMETTDSTAYFLPDGFKKYRPLFITWEVSEIDSGMFHEFIDEQAFVEKYKFNFFPNPTFDNCYINYTLPGNSDVQLILFNAMGQQQELLINKNQYRGQHQAHFSVSEFSAGLYFYKLRIGQDILEGKFMVVH